MAETTISVGKRFHDWLKDKGKKGESYEEVIKRMLAPEYLQELEEFPNQPTPKIPEGTE